MHHNILIVAHSAKAGGAETALKNLIERLTGLGHRITVLLPAAAGAFVDWCGQRGLERLVMPMQPAVPTTATSLLQISLQGWDQSVAALRERQIDLVLTNTAVILQGGHLAALIQRPHVVYVHELVQDDSEVRSHGLPSDDYLRLVARQADHLLCCSEAVQARLQALGVGTPSEVLYPYASDAAVVDAAAAAGAADAAGAAAIPADGPLQLFTLGVQSLRKNPLFGVTVLQALRLRGVDAELHCIGEAGTQTPRLQAAIARRGLVAHVHLHAPSVAPFDLLSGRRVHLVTASSEPFGLTIPEALSRGIPVVASRSGGPQALLDDASLFDVGDVDRCVRCIEAIARDPAQARQQALQRYAQLAPRFAASHQSAVVARALDSALRQYRDKAPEPHFGPALRDAVTLGRFPPAALVRSIAKVAGLTEPEVQRRIDADRQAPGQAVMADCRRFDVVPFTATAATDRLYRDGVSFAIELAATCQDGARQEMATFILSRLVCETARRPLRVLALGDGIGIDTLRLLGAGLDVDYIDFDSSLTARVARENFEQFLVAPGPATGRVRVIRNPADETPYDAVVCLEVIEHVPDPDAFLQMLSSALAPAGLLFISECFDGVRDHWPTHLHGNEGYSGLLPAMAREHGLLLDDWNPAPFGKPYVLRKPAAGETPAGLVRQLQRERGVLRQILSAQIQVGV